LSVIWFKTTRPKLKRSDLCGFSALLDAADVAFEKSRNRTLGCHGTATFDGKALKLAGFVSV
jgi:hypothetical protein